MRYDRLDGLLDRGRVVHGLFHRPKEFGTHPVLVPLCIEANAWEDGRNVVRYVPAEQVPALQKSIAEYRRFMALAEQYVSLIVRQTRQRQARQKFPSAPISRSMASPRPKKGQKKEE